jgi:hypothetical protein
VQINGSLVYSKLKTGRHAQPGEVSALLGAMIDKKRL